MNEIQEHIFLTIEACHNGWRLDKALTAVCPQLSRAQLQRLVSQGLVLVGGQPVDDNARKVKGGEEYEIRVPEPEDAIPAAEDIALDVVYEDEDLLVVNKPAGMTVHPAPGAPRGTLVNALLFHCKGQLSGIGGVKRPGIVHRIDKDTSGLLVVAKNDFTHRALTEQFTVHSIERTYLAAVYGVPNPLNGRIEGNIGRSPYDRKKMALVKNGGKAAVTNYKTLCVCGNAAALVQCNLETGRTHQIRVHLGSIGCHLIGDQLYVKNRKAALSGLGVEQKEYVCRFGRQALHAKSLGFVHPRSGRQMQFDSELPSDFSELIEVLQLK